MQQDRRKRDVSTPLSPELKWKMSLFDSREVEFWGWVGCGSLFSCVCFVSVRPFLISTKYPSFHPTPPPFHAMKRQSVFHGHGIMKTLTIWDILLLLEAVCYVVFIVLVALEFCSTSFSM